MALLDELKERSPWSDYVDHEFVKQMITGELPVSKFRYYLIQDAKYVDEMLRSVLRAASLAPRLNDSLNVVYTILSGRDRGLEVNNYLYSQLGITQEEIERTEMNEVNYNYTRHLIYHSERSWERFLIAWAPCMVGYYEVGIKVLKSPNPLYKAWASFYASDDYKRRIDVITTAINSLRIDLNDALPIFRRSVEYEIEFWNAALNAK